MKNQISTSLSLFVVVLFSSLSFIQAKAQLTVSCTHTNASCWGNDGSACASFSGGTPSYTYFWSPAGQTTTCITGLGAGTYTFIVMDDAGGTATCTSTIYSDTSHYANQSASICSGSTYVLPSGTVVSVSGVYIDTITPTSGCDSIITTTLTVNPNPTITGFSNSTICAGSSAMITAAGGVNYNWNNGTTGSSITVTPSVTTIYCVTGTDTNGCTDTACAVVTIGTQLTVFVSGPASICPGQTATLCALNGTSYSWFPAGQTTACILVSPVTTTTYAVFVTDANGCKGSTNFTLTVTCTGIEENTLSITSVFPNPSKDMIEVSFSDFVKGELKIADITGREVYSEKINANNVRVNVSALPVGYYTLSVVSETKTMREKIMIAR